MSIIYGMMMMTDQKHLQVKKKLKAYYIHFEVTVIFFCTKLFFLIVIIVVNKVTAKRAKFNNGQLKGYYRIHSSGFLMVVSRLRKQK